ncbi:MAG: homocysteine S-methyltransferase family protein, partial [Clostridia bacterium]|nr:homocysteine S-methyltransferase family protein [Clostridia bacterium]
MNNEDFYTNGIRQVIEISRSYGKKYKTSYFGTEHLLLGLLNASEGVAKSMLLCAGVDPELALRGFVNIIDKDNTAVGFTPRAKSLFQTASDIAVRYHKGYVGTEHLLYAMILDEECYAMRLLKAMKINVEQLKEDLKKRICPPATERMAKGKENNEEKPAEDFPEISTESAFSYNEAEIEPLLKYGVDLILIETMNDIYETKAAVLAVKETTDLPIFVSNVYSKDMIVWKFEPGKP